MKICKVDFCIEAFTISYLHGYSIIASKVRSRDEPMAHAKFKMIVGGDG